MKLWEAVLYALFGGFTELLPISFAGHAAILQSAFGLTSLAESDGYYIHAAISAGVVLAIFLAFRTEARAMRTEWLTMTGLRRLRRGERPDYALRRSMVLGVVALLPMLVSLIFLSSAEEISHLVLVAAFFLVNGGLIFLCCRGAVGQKDEKYALISDGFLIGLMRALAIFPGLSSFGASVCIGRVRGFSPRYNLRFSYLLTLAFHLVLFFYRLVRAICFGSFFWMTIPTCLLTVVCTTVTGYLAIQYFRYLLERYKLNVFAYYCWGAAAILLFISLINS